MPDSLFITAKNKGTKKIIIFDIAAKQIPTEIKNTSGIVYIDWIFVEIDKEINNKQKKPEMISTSVEYFFL